LGWSCLNAWISRLLSHQEKKRRWALIHLSGLPLTFRGHI
jgi:hypothetical protein